MSRPPGVIRARDDSFCVPVSYSSLAVTSDAGSVSSVGGSPLALPLPAPPVAVLSPRLLSADFHELSTIAGEQQPQKPNHRRKKRKNLKLDFLFLVHFFFLLQLLYLFHTVRTIW